MNKLLIIVFAVVPVWSTAQQTEPMVEAFFVDLKKAIEQQDTQTLKQLVYPFKDEVEDMQAGLIDNMLNGNPQQRGDGAFSMYALDALIAHHLTEVVPISDELYGQLSIDRFFGKVISGYKQQHVWVMDFHEVRLILLEKRRKFQLLFWENMNNLLHSALQPKRESGSTPQL
ncbi:hypothetical protein [Parapedobacter sp. 10938]|uniref:hypothetical protein n=1 Tax=Parapedobacter flavus TaxID=3110225 RepID=UPI002DBFB032|nr:hypothetical protein [Parapedobacter sp. 10938]MEC3879825.1 hypothetical protein [Parapedobacter sp. 10938]